MANKMKNKNRVIILTPTVLRSIWQALLVSCWCLYKIHISSSQSRVRWDCYSITREWSENVNILKLQDAKWAIVSCEGFKLLNYYYCIGMTSCVSPQLAGVHCLVMTVTMWVWFLTLIEADMAPHTTTTTTTTTTTNNRHQHHLYDRPARWDSHLSTCHTFLHIWLNHCNVTKFAVCISPSVVCRLDHFKISWPTCHNLIQKCLFPVERFQMANYVITWMDMFYVK